MWSRFCGQVSGNRFVPKGPSDRSLADKNVDRCQGFVPEGLDEGSLASRGRGMMNLRQRFQFTLDQQSTRGRGRRRVRGQLAWRPPTFRIGRSSTFPYNLAYCFEL
jgi:hypothetical protein